MDGERVERWMMNGEVFSGITTQPLPLGAEGGVMIVLQVEQTPPRRRSDIGGQPGGALWRESMRSLKSS